MAVHFQTYLEVSQQSQVFLPDHPLLGRDRLRVAHIPTDHGWAQLFYPRSRSQQAASGTINAFYQQAEGRPSGIPARRTCIRGSRSRGAWAEGRPEARRSKKFKGLGSKRRGPPVGCGVVCGPVHTKKDHHSPRTLRRTIEHPCTWASRAPSAAAAEPRDSVGAREGTAAGLKSSANPRPPCYGGCLAWDGHAGGGSHVTDRRRRQGGGRGGWANHRPSRRNRPSSSTDLSKAAVMASCITPPPPPGGRSEFPS